MFEALRICGALAAVALPECRRLSACRSAPTTIPMFPNRPGAL